MKSLMLTLALGLGALGLTAMTPGEAKAWHGMGMWGGMWGSRGFGGLTQFNGTRTVSSTTSGSSVMLTINQPSGVRSTLTPGGVAQMFFGPSTKTITFNNSTGQESVMNSSRATQFVFTPYANLPRFFTIDNRVFTNPIGLGFGAGSMLTRFSSPITTMPGNTFVSPFMNLAAMGGLSTLAAVSNANAFSLFLSGEPESETAAAYRDYVPPGIIK
jgi:hypothetical protein